MSASLSASVGADLATPALFSCSSNWSVDSLSYFNTADGARVVLIDLDPHASLTRAFGVPTDPPPAGSHDLFNPGGAELRSLARGTAIDNLLLVAAQPALATLERRGATPPGLGLSIGRALHAARANFDYAVLPMSWKQLQPEEQVLVLSNRSIPDNIAGEREIPRS